MSVSFRDGFQTRRQALVGGLALATGACSSSLPRSSWRPADVWTFDRFDAVGGHETSVEGGPRLTESPWGPAVRFDGIDDALFISTPS